MGVDDPPGVQNFSRCPDRTPPARSSSSRSVMPSGASYWPGTVTCPLREKMPNPVDFWVPIPANQAAPSVMIDGTEAIDSTLLITVGQGGGGGPPPPRRGGGFGAGAAPGAPRASPAAPSPRRRCPRPPGGGGGCRGRSRGGGCGGGGGRPRPPQPGGAGPAAPRAAP